MSLTSLAPANPPTPPTDRSVPVAPLLQPDQMEGMFGGLEKMGDSLPMERRQQMDQLLATSVDPDEDKAGWANVAFLSDRFGKPPQEVAQNADAYRENYAEQMGWGEAGNDDKSFYSRVGQHFETMKQERGLLGEGGGKLFDHFHTGGDDWRQSFTQSLSEMKGKPGFDPKRLDLYRQLAQQQWHAWEAAGQHYPAAVEAISAWMKEVRHPGPAPRWVGEVKDSTRPEALAALKTIPEADQDAVIGLALRGLPSAEETGFVEKTANRVARGAGELAVKGYQGLSDLVRMNPAFGGSLGSPLADQAARKVERKLDQAVAGTADPNTSNNWLGKGVLLAADGLPSMAAMFTPAGIAINLGAFSEQARGHFEDAGISPEKAAILGPLAGIGLTALQTNATQVVMGKAVPAALETWMTKNLADKTGAALVKGYTKNMISLAAIDTAKLGVLTMGQQLSEPAVQAVAAQLDKTIPGIKWSGKDGEFSKLYKATPETLAGLVPLVVLGTGVGMLRHRAFARNTVHNEGMLRAVGLPDEAVKLVMDQKSPEAAVSVLQASFEKREDNPAAVEALNAKAPKGADQNDVTLADDGTYIVKDETGKPVDLTGSAEMAAKAIKEGPGEPVDLTGEGLGGAKARSQALGISNPHLAQAVDFIRSVGYGVRNIWKELRDIPAFGKYKEVIREFNGELQRRGMILEGEVRAVFDAVPDKLTQRAMYRAIEAGFDKKTLQDWAKGSTRLSSKQAYEAALALTPEQIAYAKKMQQWFEAKHPQAVAAGLLDPAQKRANYVPLMVDKPYDVKGNPSIYGGKMKGDFSHAITREFENTFNLETATDEHGHNLGMKVKSDILGEVMAAYGAELDKVDLTRQALKALESAKAKASDGEPLVQGVHGVITKNPDKGSTISNPSSVVSEGNVKYETLDHPAFKRWYFAGTEEGPEGEKRPVMMKGEMGLHPEIFGHLQNVLGRSKIQNWAESPGGAVKHLAQVAFKALETSQRFIKANMFSASAFHATHIGTRAAGNLVAPWEVKRVNASDPSAINAMRLGLQLHSDFGAMQAVKEGLGGEKKLNVLSNVPGVGTVVDKITELTFHDIIPAYKLETWKQLNTKNLKLFAKDIAAGRATADQVGAMTADQVNARFGEQNWNDLGIDPTWRHVISLLGLAPDFWRSNMQNFKQVGVGLTGAKSGREPMKAFVITAGVTFLVSKILSKALSDDDSYHFEEPFAVVAGNRTYSFRTEVQDLQTMATKPGQYLMGRLSPYASSALEYISGVNWRGEKVNAADVLKETAGKAIPQSMKWLPVVSEADEWATGRRATTSHFEQFLTSQGIRVGRHSPLNAAYKLAGEYKADVLKVDDKKTTYPVSKFQQLRYALEDGDTEKAKAEFKLLAKEETPAKLARGLHSSIFHPWTGSHRTDVAFKASLDAADRAKVEEAEAHRLDIWAAFQHIHDTGPEEPAESP